MSKSDLEQKFATQLDGAGLRGYEREYRFCPPRLWRFDFAWPTRSLAVEIEGAVWSGGRHTRGGGFEADAEKYATALLLGWRVLRVPGSWVRGSDPEGIKWTAALLGSREPMADTA